MKIWLMSEAFALDQADNVFPVRVHAYAEAFSDKRSCMKKLRERVATRVEEGYGDLDGDKEMLGYMKREIKYILSHPVKHGNGLEYRFDSAEDRLVVWDVYPQEVK